MIIQESILPEFCLLLSLIPPYFLGGNTWLKRECWTEQFLNIPSDVQSAFFSSLFSFPPPSIIIKGCSNHCTHWSFMLSFLNSKLRHQNFSQRKKKPITLLWAFLKMYPLPNYLQDIFPICAFFSFNDINISWIFGKQWFLSQTIFY